MSGSITPTPLVTKTGMFQGNSVSQGTALDVQGLLTLSKAALDAGVVQAAQLAQDVVDANAAAQATVTAAAQATANINAGVAQGLATIAATTDAVTQAVTNANAASASALSASVDANRSATGAGNAAITASNAATNATTAATNAATNLTGAQSASQTATAQAGAAQTAAGTATSQANLAAAYAASVNAARRNVVVNPRFNINQRGPGSISNSGSTSFNIVDRWSFVGQGGGTRTISAAPLSGADMATMGDESLNSYVNLTVAGTSGAGDYEQLIQRIEDVRRLAGKVLTLSFWARSPSSLVLGGCIVETFGTGGSGNQVNGAMGFTTGVLPTTWKRFVFPLTMQGSTGSTYGTAGTDYSQLQFFASAGANSQGQSVSTPVQSGTILIAGVQLEVGNSATALESTLPGENMRACQRFYQTIRVSTAGYAAAGGTIGQTLALEAMRSVPAVATLAVAATSNVQGNPGAEALGTNIHAFASASATGGVSFDATFSLSAEF